MASTAPPLTRRRFIKQSALATSALVTGSSCSQPETSQSAGDPARPNIVFLFTDDQRADALGAAGNPIIQTPHLDQLAAEGVLFTNNFVTTSICAVSRASVLTGQYARTHGIHGFQTSFSPEQREDLYPVLLRNAGYRTGFVGKYGVGVVGPLEPYDYSWTFSGQGRFFPAGEGRGKHLTEIMGDRAVEFVDGCSGDQPFCLSVSFKAPHVQDNQAPYFLNDPVYDDLYAAVEIPPFPKSDPSDHAALPTFLQGDYEGRLRWERRFSTPEKYQEGVKRYYRLITGVDTQVGRIVKAVERRGWADNTVFIFTSDNGFYLGERGLAGKWLMHEESIRTPLIIRDPRASAAHGTTRPEMSLNIDMCSTILGLAGIDPPTGAQGRDLGPLVRGESPDWRSEFFYEHLFEHSTIPKTEGVRGSRWKYTRYIETDPVFEELYDLKNDPGELKNLAADRSNPVLGEMRERLGAWRASFENNQPDTPWKEPT